jgi:hypothetical protein
VPIVYPDVKNADTLADLLAWPGPEGPINRIQIERSTTGGGVGFSNIGSVTVTTGTLEYTFYDTTGLASDWYRWYFSNAANTFPASANREYSPEVQPSEVGAGLLVDPAEAFARIVSNGGTLNEAEQEQVTNYVAQVSAWMQGPATNGRKFARSPASGIKTWTENVPRMTRRLWLPQGLAALTTLEVATQTGGTYTTVPSTDWFLEPTPLPYGGTYTRIELSDIPTGSTGYFYPGYRTVRLTGAEGWPAVPEDLKAIALRLIVAAHRERASSGGDSFTINIDGSRVFERALSYSDRMTLESYRAIPVG